MAFTCLAPLSLSRCHPDLSLIPNRCFYGGRLIDGCGPSDRPSLLGPAVPPLLFCALQGQAVQAAHSRSSSNPQVGGRGGHHSVT